MVRWRRRVVCPSFVDSRECWINSRVISIGIRRWRGVETVFRIVVAIMIVDGLMGRHAVRHRVALSSVEDLKNGRL